MLPTSPSKLPGDAAWHSASEHHDSNVSGTRRVLASAAPIERGPGGGQDAAKGWLSRCGRRALDVSWRLDAKLQGRLPRLLAVLATVSSGLGPVLVLWHGSPAHGAAYCAGFACVCLLLLGFVWLAQAREKGGAWRLRVAGHRIAAALRLSVLDLGDLARAPKRLKLFIVGRFALGIGLVGLGVSSCLSFVRLLRQLPVGSQLAGLTLLSGSLLVGSELLRWALHSQTERQETAGAELSIAVREFSGIVDLALPLQVETMFMHPTAVHRVMSALSEWPRTRWGGAEGYTAALQRHLQRCLPRARVERHRWLGDSYAQGPADLVVDDTVLIEVQVGFSPTFAKEGFDRLHANREASGNKPIVWVVFDAPSGDSLESDATEALLALHDSALLLTVLMPAANDLASAAQPMAKSAELESLRKPAT